MRLKEQASLRMSLLTGRVALQTNAKPVGAGLGAGPHSAVLQVPHPYLVPAEWSCQRARQCACTGRGHLQGQHSGSLKVDSPRHTQHMSGCKSQRFVRPFVKPSRPEGCGPSGVRVQNEPLGPIAVHGGGFSQRIRI